MSTNNFKYENVLVVTPDFTFKHDCIMSECEEGCDREGEGEEFDQWSYDEYKKEMQITLSHIKLPKCIGGGECDRYNNDRSYGGTVIYDFQVYNKDGYIYTSVEVVIRNGYYDGMNIDYTINREDGDDSKKLDKSVTVLCGKIEKVLKKYGGEEYLKVGGFSNGEAIYQKK